MTPPLPEYLLEALDRVFGPAPFEDVDPVIPAIKVYAAQCVAAAYEAGWRAAADRAERGVTVPDVGSPAYEEDLLNFREQTP